MRCRLRTVDVIDINGLMMDLSFAIADERDINDMVNHISLNYLALVISFMKSDKGTVIWN